MKCQELDFDLNTTGLKMPTLASTAVDNHLKRKRSSPDNVIAAVRMSRSEVKRSIPPGTEVNAVVSPNMAMSEVDVCPTIKSPTKTFTITSSFHSMLTPAVGEGRVDSKMTSRPVSYISSTRSLNALTSSSPTNSFSAEPFHRLNQPLHSSLQCGYPNHIQTKGNSPYQNNLLTDTETKSRKKFKPTSGKELEPALVSKTQANEGFIPSGSMVETSETLFTDLQDLYKDHSLNAFPSDYLFDRQGTSPYVDIQNLIDFELPAGLSPHASSSLLSPLTVSPSAVSPYTVSSKTVSPLSATSLTVSPPSVSPYTPPESDSSSSFSNTTSTADSELLDSATHLTGVFSPESMQVFHTPPTPSQVFHITPASSEVFHTPDVSLQVFHTTTASSDVFNTTHSSSHVFPTSPKQTQVFQISPKTNQVSQNSCEPTQLFNEGLDKLIEEIVSDDSLFFPKNNIDRGKSEIFSNSNSKTLYNFDSPVLGITRQNEFKNRIREHNANSLTKSKNRSHMPDAIEDEFDPYVVMSVPSDESNTSRGQSSVRSTLPHFYNAGNRGVIISPSQRIPQKTLPECPAGLQNFSPDAGNTQVWYAQTCFATPGPGVCDTQQVGKKSSVKTHQNDSTNVLGTTCSFSALRSELYGQTSAVPGDLHQTNVNNTCASTMSETHPCNENIFGKTPGLEPSWDTSACPNRSRPFLIKSGSKQISKRIALTQPKKLNQPKTSQRACSASRQFPEFQSTPAPCTEPSFDGPLPSLQSTVYPILDHFCKAYPRDTSLTNLDLQHSSAPPPSVTCHKLNIALSDDLIDLELDFPASTHNNDNFINNFDYL